MYTGKSQTESKPSRVKSSLGVVAPSHQPGRTARTRGSSWLPVTVGSQESGSQPRPAPGDQYIGWERLTGSAPARLAFLTGRVVSVPFLLCFTPLRSLEHSHRGSGHIPEDAQVRLGALDSSGPTHPSSTAE